MSEERALLVCSALRSEHCKVTQLLAVTVADGQLTLADGAFAWRSAQPCPLFLPELQARQLYLNCCSDPPILKCCAAGAAAGDACVIALTACSPEEAVQATSSALTASWGGSDAHGGVLNHLRAVTASIAAASIDTTQLLEGCTRVLCERDAMIRLLGGQSEAVKKLQHGAPALAGPAFVAAGYSSRARARRGERGPWL